MQRAEEAMIEMINLLVNTVSRRDNIVFIQYGTTTEMEAAVFLKRDLSKAMTSFSMRIYRCNIAASTYLIAKRSFEIKLAKCKACVAHTRTRARAQ